MDNQVNQSFGVATQQAEIKCSNCGATLAPGQAFCASCGTPAPAPAPTPIAVPTANTCSNCGSELPMDAEFCSNCGHRKETVTPEINPAIAQYNSTVAAPKNKKNKKIIISVVAGVLAVLAIIIGVLVNNSIQEQKAAEEARLLAEAVEEYKDNAYDFYLKVLSSGSTMEDIGNEIQKSWKAYVNSSYYNGKRYYSVDSAVSAAQTYMYSDISSVKSANSSIEALYKELLVIPDTNDQVLIELKNVVKETYEAYKDMYDCVIDPSGNYTSWTSEFGNTDSELADAIGDLNELLD